MSLAYLDPNPSGSLLNSVLAVLCVLAVIGIAVFAYRAGRGNGTWF